MARRSRISEALIEVIKNESNHAWTLEDLHSALTKRRQPVNFSSVFRAVEKLVDKGRISRVLIDGRAHFELEQGHHDHLACSRCGILLPVPCVVLGATLNKIRVQTGFTITGHSLLVTGICPSCRTERVSKGFSALDGLESGRP